MSVATMTKIDTSWIDQLLELDRVQAALAPLSTIGLCVIISLADIKEAAGSSERVK